MGGVGIKEVFSREVEGGLRDLGNVFLEVEV